MGLFQSVYVRLGSLAEGAIVDPNFYDPPRHISTEGRSMRDPSTINMVLSLMNKTVKTFMRFLVVLIVSLPKQLLAMCIGFFYGITALPRKVKQTGFTIIVCLHPSNLRQLSFRTLIQRATEVRMSLREMFKPESLREMSGRHLLLQWCSARCCLRVLSRAALVTCLTCGAALVTVVLTQDAGAVGLRHLITNSGGYMRHFQSPLPKARRVILVEEHQEVLKYWYEAAEEGRMAKEGLTLFRFSSHFGASPLSYVGDSFPLFHWPKRFDELRHMIQDSDDYVMAAAFAKMIKRYIWVWPSWNERKMASDTGYDVYGMHLGWAKRSMEGGRKVHKEICGCLVNDGFSVCRVRNTTHPKLSPFGLAIPREQCNLEHRGILEIVRDDVAQDKLETEVDWLPPTESVLLDIDADFYGSLRPALRLLDEGFTEPMILNISQAAGRMLCPRSSQQENVADRILVNIINNVQTYRYCRFQKCVDHLNFAKLKQRSDSMVAEFESDPDLYGMFCSHNIRKRRAMLDTLINLLIRLTSSQLNALRMVGFCLRTSPKSLDFSSRTSLHICTGKRHLGKPEVRYYSPTKGEVMNRTGLLQEILFDGVINPKVVTLSRSVRQGFAPRDHISLIEDHLLTTVFQVVNKNTSAVHYDKDLFCGIHGWQVRGKLLSANSHIWNDLM